MVHQSIGHPATATRCGSGDVQKATGPPIHPCFLKHEQMRHDTFRSQTIIAYNTHLLLTNSPVFEK